MARLMSMILLLVLVACSGKKKDADRASAEESSVMAATAAQAVVERKGLLTLSEQVADAEAPEKLKAIAPAVAVGQMIERRVSPTMIEVDLCVDENPDRVITELGAAVKRTYNAGGVSGGYQVTLSWPSGEFAVRQNSGYDRCPLKSQFLVTVTIQIKTR